MTKARKSWKMFLPFEIFMNTIFWKSFGFSLISLHLSNIINEMLWLFEEFQFFSINKVSKLIFNLNNKLNSVETVKTVVSEIRINSDTSFFGGSEVILNHRQDVLLNFIIGFQNKCVFLFGFHIFPKGNLV